MKKLLLFAFGLLVTLISCAQPSNIQVESIKLSGIIYGTESGGIDTVIIPSTDTAGQWLYKSMADPANPLDGVNLRTLQQASFGGGWDSLYWDAFTGYLTAWKTGAVVDSTNLDLRYVTLIFADTTYVSIADSGVAYVTPQDLDSVVAGAAKDVFSVSLPPSTTVAGRIAGAVEGTDYPTGWTLAVGSNATDLVIVHDMERHIASVNIYALVPGGYHQLLMNTAAYNGIQSQSNAITINSLATVNLRIYIELIFSDHGD